MVTCNDYPAQNVQKSEEHNRQADAVSAPTADPVSPKRRRFLKFIYASSALGIIAGTGCREKQKILPLTRMPMGLVPGEDRYYATCMELGGVAVGLRVRSYDGRPVKVEGNPLHPSSSGAAMAIHQASIWDLYNADRLQTPIYNLDGRQESTWHEFEKFATNHFTSMQKTGGAGLRVLAGVSSSPTRTLLKDQLLTAFPQAQWIEYEAISSANTMRGSVLAFGKSYRSHPRLDKAKALLCLDSDPAGRDPDALANARALMAGRRPDEHVMNRIYVVEDSFSATGGLADHRLPLKRSRIKAFAAALAARVGARVKPMSQQILETGFLKDPVVDRFLTALTEDLTLNTGQSLILVGPDQPPEVHALGHHLNALLGNAGKTVEYSEGPPAGVDQDHTALVRLTSEIAGGAVETLVILAENPAFTVPGDIPFADSLEKIKNTTIYLGLYEDDTAKLCRWVLPETHFLEAWGDARAYDGTIMLAQPLIKPIFNGRSEIEFLALLLGKQAAQGMQLVRKAHSVFNTESDWRQARHDGFIKDSAYPRVVIAPGPIEPSATPLHEHESGGGRSIELTFAPDAKLYDGRFANNSQLQELPDPITKLSWDNAALMAPQTARRFGIDDGEIAQIRVEDRTLSIPIIYAPGQAEGSARLVLGYGGQRADRGGSKSGAVAPVVGVNTYSLQTATTPGFVTGATIVATGKKATLALTQHLYAIDWIGRQGEAKRLDHLIPEATLLQYKADPDFCGRSNHHPPLVNLWTDPATYQEGQRWGMSIDLNKCMGCGACVLACQAENNIPTVGRTQVRMGREMHWIHIDRYYRGAPEATEIVHQPMLCQQCENAPCEQVCPVGATIHTREGLNDMIYNRCIGTRFCSNNCPYQVRRFNYFDLNARTGNSRDLIETMANNPEVTVRSRGVTEKCSFCSQRIQLVRIRAKETGRPLKDGEPLTACQQTCPTGAIVFGNLNNPDAQVTDAHRQRRGYRLLEELNIRPRITYLARITNLNPKLS